MSHDPTPFLNLLSIVAKLRNPDGGCPWDLEQTHQTLTPYVIEEAYEVVEAIQNSMGELPGELGDLLLQVVLHCQIASEEKRFDIGTVCTLISEKLVRRHPHVFGDTAVDGTKQVLENWEKIKQKELSAGKSILDGVPRGMPALLRSQRIGEKAARVGFDWGTTEEVCDKILEEVREFTEARSKNLSKELIEDEFGDILFSLAQLARKMDLTAEDMLQRATDKFSRRFKEVEKRAGKPLSEFTMEALDAIWDEVKKDEQR